MNKLVFIELASRATMIIIIIVKTNELENSKE